MAKTSETNRLIAEQRRRESVQCPACGYVFDWESMASVTTYWGNDGPQERDCPNCETPLLITERVSRTYEVKFAQAAKAKGE